MRISKLSGRAPCVTCALLLMALLGRSVALATSVVASNGSTVAAADDHANRAGRDGLRAVREPQIDIDALAEKVSTAGTLKVIVTLKLPMPYVAEEQLVVPAAIERQRASITLTRNALLASLRGTNAREYTKLHPRPQVALRVDAAALRALAQSPQAAAIEEDARPGTLAPEYLPELARLTEKAVQSGTVNVIVGLKLSEPYRPETKSTERGVIERQRAAIAQARAALLDSLRATGATAYAQWDPLPMVALKVNAAALRLLAESSLITTIKEDGFSRPQ